MDAGVAELARNAVSQVLPPRSIKAWVRFEPVAYAHQVVANLDLREQTIAVTSDDLLAAVGVVPALRHIKLETPVDHLHDLERLTELESLQAVGMIRESLDGLGRLTSLRRLDLRRNRAISDLSGLSQLGELEELHLDHCDSITDLDVLAGLSRLRILWVNSLTEVRAWGWTAGLTALRTLSIDDCAYVRLDSVRSLSDLRTLYADLPGGSADLSPLRSCGLLWRLRLRLPADVAADAVSLPAGIRSLELRGQVTAAVIDRLAGLPELTKLTLSDVRGLTDTAAFGALSGLNELTINDVRSIDDWSGLASLRRLERRDLSGSSVSNLQFATGMTGLRSATLNGCVNLADVEGLDACPALTRLSLQGIGGQLAASVDELASRNYGRRLEIDYDPFGDNDFAVS